MTIKNEGLALHYRLTINSGNTLVINRLSKGITTKARTVSTME